MAEIDDREQEASAQTRPFAAVLQELNRGSTHAELSREMQDLVAAVQETGRKGSITLKLEVKPTGDTGAITVADTVTVSAPSFDRPSSLFYVTGEHNLVRSDPRQMELPLREATVDLKTGELKEIAP